jgi:rSAM/selenodomain-associated transferase 2
VRSEGCSDHSPMKLAVVIPTLNEAQVLPLLLSDLGALASSLPLEVIVADGGSTDGTIAGALVSGARVVFAPRGRARPLNAGAWAAGAEWLLFLHADSRLGQRARDALLQALIAPPRFGAAVFRFAIDLPPLWRRVVEWGQAFREAVWRLPYGDQGLLVPREVFAVVGGYPELPLMEDVAMIRALRRRTRIERLPAALLTSGRRYRRSGIARTALEHTALITLYSLGVSPVRLARWRSG